MAIMNVGFRFLFLAFPVIFAVAFFCIAFVIIRMIVKNMRRWNANSAAPRLTVPARVVAKRTQVSGFRRDMPARGGTSYYITFEVDSGDRMELSMEGEDFGLLAEGDVGLLTFQGTRHLGFDRSR